LLLDYLDTESNTTDKAFKELAKIANDRFNRNKLIDEIIDLSINIVGRQKIALRSLYIQLNLDHDSMIKIQSKKWHIKVKGFKELAYMNIRKESIGKAMKKALQSKNKFLRMESQLALVRFNKRDPFSFLDHLEYPFTLWEQLNVHELIEVHDLPIPQFSRWIRSSNTSVVLFALRMIHVFKQTNAVQAVSECLDNPIDEIRHMAIVICGEISLRELLPKLKSMYKNENYKNCLAIVQTMGKMPDESVINFLKLVLDKEDDIQLQINSAIAISKTGEAGISALVKLMKSEYKNYQIIIRHVLDKRIM
jgi:hypothetical protein